MNRPDRAPSASSHHPAQTNERPWQNKRLASSIACRDGLAATRMAIVETTSPVQRTIGGIQRGMYLRYPEVWRAAIEPAARPSFVADSHLLDQASVLRQLIA